ncbi:hypothetical protein D4764_19G0009700 [Takifugu flavidus]|uniref:Uncharacterized protein n=1 Tax=Takifugu flavidus TaxID=433684 RepID=A0A5C6NRD3_9TELE|nr:hypothetical protein D4764_19G0009700 [Takifugu flavidus]
MFLPTLDQSLRLLVFGRRISVAMATHSIEGVRFCPRIQDAAQIKSDHLCSGPGLEKGNAPEKEALAGPE